MTKKEANIKFGQRVLELRTQRGYTQEQLSYQCDINRTYMGAIERGEKTPSLITIEKIAKGLNYSTPRFSTGG